MLYREARLRATNATFIFLDVVYPLAHPLSRVASDVLRYATIGLGSPGMIALQVALFLGFAGISFAIAMRALMRRE